MILEFYIRTFFRRICTFLFLLLWMNINTLMAQEPNQFVAIENGTFIREGQPYYFIGTNLWYGMNLGAKGEGGDKERLIRELDRLAEMGVDNLRIIGGSEGPDTEPWRIVPAVQPAPGVYREEVLAGLDFLLDEMAKRNMVAVICLTNFWPWSGGMAQYVSWSTGKKIPYPPPAEKGSWATYQLYTSKFYKDKKALSMYESYVRFLLKRKNTVNGKLYCDDPTIMSWELANEPRGIFSKRAYRRWIQRSAALIRSLSSHHLITIGSEGYTPSRLAGNRFKKDHSIKYIDYATLHIWVQNWGWYDPLKPSSYPQSLEKAKDYLSQHISEAAQLNIPLVLEEFGISRDENSHSSDAGTSIRNLYYMDMFHLLENSVEKNNILVGMNFWAWGGEGRPSMPESIWKAEDDFTGDPPHEFQGWYSVYNTDYQTIKLITESGKKLLQRRIPK